MVSGAGDPSAYVPSGWGWEETDTAAAPPAATQPRPPFVEVSEHDGGEDRAPETEDIQGDAQAFRNRITSAGGKGGWSHRLHLVVFGAVVLLTVALTIEWAVELVRRTPLFGWPALILLVILIISFAIEAARQWLSVTRLREAEGIREAFSQARLGKASESALRAATANLCLGLEAPQQAEFQDGVPKGADQRILVEELERSLLSERDTAAVAAIVHASRQAALVALVSPSAVADIPLYLFRSYMLMGTVAGIYGHRPAALARSRLIKRAIADGSMLGVAMVVFDEAARSGGNLIKHAGSHIARAGTVVTAAGHGMVGVPAELVGVAMSGAGELAEEVGGPLSEGLAAALRLARFGLLAIMATRPIPLQRKMEAGLAREIRVGILSLRKR